MFSSCIGRDEELAHVTGELSCSRFLTTLRSYHAGNPASRRTGLFAYFLESGNIKFTYVRHSELCSGARKPSVGEGRVSDGGSGYGVGYGVGDGGVGDGGVASPAELRLAQAWHGRPTVPRLRWA
jgi:hypothetical protein